MKYLNTSLWRRFKDATSPPPLKEVLSENGQGSFTRTAGFLVVVSVLGWGWVIVLTQHKIPDQLEQMALFMTVGAGTPYGIGQVKQIIVAAKTGQIGGGCPPEEPKGVTGASTN